MLDNQLFALIISTIISQESIAGIPGTPIKQAFQPTQQGINTAPTAYLYKISDERVGYPARSDVWDDVNDIMVHTEMQQYASTFQISALSTQDPTNTAQYTASDTLNLIAYILQSTATIAAFEAQSVGIQNVMQIRNPSFIDDRQRHEFSPSFDFTVTHQQLITSTSPSLSSTTIGLYRV